MAAEAIADRTRTNARLAALLASKTAARLHPRRLLRFTPHFSEPDHLLTAPPPVTEGNAMCGATLYAGSFSLAGVDVETAGRSVFEIQAPSTAWARALHGFGWLEDLAAAETALAAAFARAAIEDWIAFGRNARAAQRSDVSARRVLCWLTFAPFFLEGADAGFRRRFFRELARHGFRLRRDVRRLPSGMPRLLAAIALTQTGLCLPDSARALRTGSDSLAVDLKAMILPDGGPATRNPADLLALVLDLLPLRATFVTRGVEPPKALQHALDRMLPMLRFFQHGDGALALFNGMGPTDQARLDAVLAIDDAQGKPVNNAGFSGYQRIEAGNALVLVDTGGPPRLALSAAAHAGRLSFEFSTGAQRLVVNCGAPGPGNESWRANGRKTAAHSTVMVGDRSSCVFVRGRLLTSLLGTLVRHGPRKVEVGRDDGHGGTLLRTSHDGYALRLGMVHERTLRLHADGNRLDGVDVLRPVRRGTASEAVIRFHLHPDVRANRLGGGQSVLLTLPSGECWVFTAENHETAIEESVHFAGPDGPRRADQIVVRLGRKAGARQAWSFVRMGSEASRAALALF